MSIPNRTHTCSLIMMFSCCILISPGLCSSNNVLYSDIGGGKLLAGQSLVYRNYRLTMEMDCDLTLFGPNNNVIWTSGTSWRPMFNVNCYLSLTPRGQLIIYGTNLWGFGKIWVLWKSGKPSAVDSRYALVLKHDGSIHVYGPVLWSEPTSPNSIAIDTKSAGNVDTRPAITDSTFWSNDNAPIGTIIENNDYKLVLQENCNLTLSNSNTGKVLWYTNSEDRLYDCFVNLEANGELMIKYLSGATLWRSGAKDITSDYVLSLRPDGELAVYGPSILSCPGCKETVSAELYGEKIAMLVEK